jgi:hypothetical protein
MSGHMHISAPEYGLTMPAFLRDIAYKELAMHTNPTAPVTTGICWRPMVETLPYNTFAYDEGDAIFVEDIGAAYIVRDGQFVQITSSCHEEVQEPQVDHANLVATLERLKADFIEELKTMGSLEPGDRVLLANQGDARRNGVYTYDPMLEAAEEFIFGRGSADFTIEGFMYPSSAKKHLSSRSSSWLDEYDEFAADIKSMARPGRKILSSRD